METEKMKVRVEGGGRGVLSGSLRPEEARWEQEEVRRSHLEEEPPHESTFITLEVE